MDEISEIESPTFIVAETGLKFTPVTETRLTLTGTVAVIPPSTVVAVTVAEPTPTPVISPVALTVATAVLLLLQVIF